jgi:hypothetical protein
VLIFEPTDCPRRTVNTVPAGTTKDLAAAGFMFDTAVFDMAEPEPPLDDELAMLPPLLLSLEDGDEVEEELESAGAAGLLQPSRTKDK